MGQDPNTPGGDDESGKFLPSILNALPHVGGDSKSPRVPVGPGFKALLTSLTGLPGKVTAAATNAMQKDPRQANPKVSDQARQQTAQIAPFEFASGLQSLNIDMMDPAGLGTMLQAMIIYPNPDMGSNIATARNMVEHFLFAGQKQDTGEQVAMSYEPIAHNTEGTVRTMRFHMYVCGNAQPKVIQHYTCIADVPSFAQPTVQESGGSLYLGIQAAQPQDELDVIMEVPKGNLGSVKAVGDDGKTAKLKPESFQEKSQQEVTHINGPANGGGWVEMPRNAAQIFLNRLGIDDENVSGNHSNLTAGDYILYAMYQRNGSGVIVYVADRLEQKKMFAGGKGKDKTAPCKVSAFVRTPDGRFFQHETIIERGDLPEVRPEKNPFQIVGGLKGTQIMTLDPKDPTQQVSEKKGAEYVVETRQRYARNWV